MVKPTTSTDDDDDDEDENEDNLLKKFFVIISIIMFILFLPLSLFFCVRILPEFKRGVHFRLGRVRKHNPRGPGIVFILACIDDLVECDLRTVTFDVPPQEILTKDSVTIKVDAVIYYHLNDPMKAILTIQNYFWSTQLLAQTTLRNVLGTKNLTETLSEKEIISQTMQNILDLATDPWGIKVERVEIKDVRLPIQLQRAMAAEAEAIREARAKIVAADGEMQASEALKMASDVISSSPAALQLRYLQTLNAISTEHNSTIIFPFPIEFFKK